MVKNRHEEVNAWGNYGLTAKNARDLSFRNVRSSSVRFRGSGTLFKRDSTSDRLAQTVHGSRLSPSAIFSMLDRTDEEIDILEKQGETDPSSKESVDTATQKDDEVEGESKTHSDMKRIFSVYFDDKATGEEEICELQTPSASSIWSKITSVNATMPWLSHFIEESMPVPGFWLFVELCLRGISQVYFQSNPFTGLLMLTGLFVQSPRVAVHGVLSVVCGNLIAYLLGMDKGMIKAGLFGYNGTSGGLSKTGLRYKFLLTRCLLVRSRIGWSCYSYVSYARDAL
jgi:hypothetical protein